MFLLDPGIKTNIGFQVNRTMVMDKLRNDDALKMNWLLTK